VTDIEPSREGPGRTIALPLRHGELIPDFPDGGLQWPAHASQFPGARVIEEGDSPGPSSNPDVYAHVKTSLHHNLYQVTLP
jgi:hypothetical protein